MLLFCYSSLFTFHSSLKELSAVDDVQALLRQCDALALQVVEVAVASLTVA